MLSRDHVLGVAKLARLDLNEDQLVKFKKQLEDVLKLFDEVKSIDVEGVEETSQVTGLKSVTREDTVKCDPCNTDELLQNVPIKDGTNIVVPKVIK